MYILKEPAHKKLSFNFGLFFRITTTTEIPHNPTDLWISNGIWNTVSNFRSSLIVLFLTLSSILHPHLLLD